jgi:ParB-like chromosome segregation protein Spo0J
MRHVRNGPELKADRVVTSVRPGGSPRPADAQGRLCRDLDDDIVLVETSALILANSPRLQGENPRHTRLLAQTDATLPPILVHQATMQVIDGIHRVRAAQIKGESTIAARFYDGTEDTAFILAVEQNVTHGLPLSLADRKAAATRILTSHPNWSDRTIAASTGLSDRTVRTIRQRSTADSPRLNARADHADTITRIGRDGRARPMNCADGRRRASQILAEEPTCPLRTVAETAGVSLGTAHDVRERIRRGDDPATLQRGRTAPATRSALPHSPIIATSDRDPRSILEALKKDPSLKFTDAGRYVLRWLCSHALEPQDWEVLLPKVPAHSTQLVAELARSTADAWRDLAHELEQRSHRETPHSAV